MHKYMILLFLLLVNLTAVSQKDNQAEITKETDFLVNLMDNIEWPLDSAGKSDGIFTIVIIGESPLTKKLIQLAEAKSTDRRKIKIETVSAKDDFPSCRMVFLPDDNRTQLAEILKKTSGLPVLTVTDVEGFVRYGVMIEIIKNGNGKKQKIDFAVNKMVLKKAGLKIDKKFLKKAKKTIG